jgi:hypothetical protein
MKSLKKALNESFVNEAIDKDFQRCYDELKKAKGTFTFDQVESMLNKVAKGNVTLGTLIDKNEIVFDTNYGWKGVAGVKFNGRDIVLPVEYCDFERIDESFISEAQDNTILQNAFTSNFKSPKYTFKVGVQKAISRVVYVVIVDTSTNKEIELSVKNIDKNSVKFSTRIGTAWSLVSNRPIDLKGNIVDQLEKSDAFRGLGNDSSTKMSLSQIFEKS